MKANLRENYHKMSILFRPNNLNQYFPPAQITTNKQEILLRFKLLMIINYKWLF